MIERRSGAMCALSSAQKLFICTHNTLLVAVLFHKVFAFMRHRLIDAPVTPDRDKAGVVGLDDIDSTTRYALLMLSELSHVLSSGVCVSRRFVFVVGARGPSHDRLDSEWAWMCW